VSALPTPRDKHPTESRPASTVVVERALRVA
jgi:hypothetical protein